MSDLLETSPMQIVRALEVLQTENEFERTVVKSLRDLVVVIDRGHKGLTQQIVDLRADLKAGLDLTTERSKLALETAQQARASAHRAEGAADMAQAEVVQRTRQMRAALSTLPESVELEKIAREAGKAAGFNAAEEITERFRRAPMPSDPVRAIVDKCIEERQRDADATRLRWWQSAAFGWAMKVAGAGAGYVGLRLLEEFARHWH